MEKVLFLMLVASVIGAYVLVYPSLITRVAGSIAVAIFLTAAQNAQIYYATGMQNNTWLGLVIVGLSNLLITGFFFSRKFTWLYTEKRREGFFGYMPSTQIKGDEYASTTRGVDHTDKLMRQGQLKNAEKANQAGLPKREGWNRVN